MAVTRRNDARRHTSGRLLAAAAVVAIATLPASGASAGVGDTVCEVRSLLAVLSLQCPDQAPPPAPSPSPTTTNHGAGGASRVTPTATTQEPANRPRSVVVKPLAAPDAAKGATAAASFAPAPGETLAVEPSAPVASTYSLNVFIATLAAAALLGLLALAIRFLLFRRRAAAAERAALQVKQDIIANVGHEIATPLTGVTGNATLIAQRALTPSQRKHAARQMLVAAAQLDRAVDLLLTYAALRAGEYSAFREELDLSAVAREATETRTSNAPDHRFDVRIPAECRVRGNDRLIRLAIEQLVDNAVKFSPDGGLIHVGVERADSRTVVIRVSDEGIGIEPEKMDELFNAFRQGDGSPTRPYGGMGLGLTFCDEVAKLYRGSIRAESTAGKGSVFTLSLPLREAGPVVFETRRRVPVMA